MKLPRSLSLALASLISLSLTPRRVLDIDPAHVDFGRQPFGSFVVQDFTITNRSGQDVLVTVDALDVGDDFSPGQPQSTCTLTGEALLGPRGTCTHVIGFEPSTPFPGRQTATLLVTARDLQGAVLDEREVRLSGTGF